METTTGSDAPIEFVRADLRPGECLRAGWELIREQYPTFLAVTAVGLFLGSAAPLGIMLGPMICGIYVCLFARMRGERIAFKMLFRGLEFFLQSYVATLVQIVPMMAVTIPINLILALNLFEKILRWLGPPYDEVLEFMDLRAVVALVAVLTVVLFFLSVTIGVFFMFSYPLIVERRMRGLAAVKLSARAASANLRGAIVLMAATTLISLGGALCCYVGAFAVTPLTLAAWAVAYRRVFPEPVTSD